MIRVDRVTKVFRSRDGADVTALSDVSMEIGRNEFVALVGASGCGKSTLLRMIGGLLSPSQGGIEVAGTPVAGPRRDTGIVFQSPTLLPWATVLDNVLFPLKIMRQVDSGAMDRAHALIDLAGLHGFDGKYPRELSGGMQQRAAICRALIQDPDILLMDEPFGALDALTREEMTLELLRIWTEQPKTIVFVTHSIPEAVLLADRVIVMSPRPGRIAEVNDVPLPRPRDFASEASPDFQASAGRIRSLIFGARRPRADTAA